MSAREHTMMLAESDPIKPVRRRYGNSSIVVRSKAVTSGRNTVGFLSPNHVPFDVSRCRDIVDTMLESEASGPFREPVSRDLYPHYYDVCRYCSRSAVFRVLYPQCTTDYF